ncbi:MAG: hypothetical protein ACREGF_01545 [Candidatus Saccharimonadales bacterium]
MNSLKNWLKRFGQVVTIFGLIGLSLAGHGAARAAACDPNLQSCSTNYGVSQSHFGSGGDLHDCSASYCAKTSIGELGVGNSSSPHYQAQAGFNTTEAPYLAFIVTGVNADLGVLSPSTTATATAQFSVKTYLASGYIVQTTGSSPMYAGHQLNPLTTPTSSSAGSEQFGMNLVANNSCGGGLPATLGASPVQKPDNSFSSGAAAGGYNTACKFQYNPGDTIAAAAKSSGETDYQASFIFNISQTTPAGQYAYNGTLIATSTY